MIPKLPLLRRLPYKSLNQGAQYDPFTLFIKYTMEGGYIVAPGLRFGDSQGDREIQQMIKDESSSFHEEFHWLQYNGTTVGAFLALLRYSQERTTINTLADPGTDYLSKSFQQRLQKNAIPIVPINNESAINASLLDEEDQLNVFRQIWYDHQLVYSIFNSSVSQDSISYPREQVFGEITSDLILYFCDRCGLRYPGNHLARKWFRFDDGEIVFVALSGKRLTTLGIFEGITTANELQLLHFRGASNEYIKKFVDLLDSSSYGVALIAFMTVLGLSPNNLDDLMSIIPTFNTVCDIALNPPLPPFFMCPPENSEHWFWRDIYPPLRLKQLVEAVNDVGFLPLGSQHESLCTYIDTLCTYIGWPSPNNYIHPFKRCNKVIDFDIVNYDPEEIRLDDSASQVLTVPPYVPASYERENGLESDFLGIAGRDNKHRDFEIKELSDFDYYHYLLWVQFKMWERRKKNLPAFINPIECRYKEELFHYYEDIGFGLLFGSIWTRPPFVWCSDDTWGYSTAYHIFNSWLFSSSCFHYFLFDIVAGTGKFDTSAYPPKMKEHKIFDTVRKSFDLTFRIKMEKEILRKEYPQKPLFALGKFLGTPRVLEAFERIGVKPEEYVLRHVMGDWGRAGNYYEITLTEEEQREGVRAISDTGKLNNWGVKNKGAITSSYTLPDKTEIWITTNYDRKYTTLYLLEER